MFQDEVYKIETCVSNFLSNKMLNLFQTQAKKKKNVERPRRNKAKEISNKTKRNVLLE